MLNETTETIKSSALIQFEKDMEKADRKVKLARLILLIGVLFSGLLLNIAIQFHINTLPIALLILFLLLPLINY